MFLTNKKTIVHKFSICVNIAFLRQKKITSKHLKIRLKTCQNMETKKC